MHAQGGNWRAQCRADLQHLMAQLESLPMSPTERASNLGPLRALLAAPDGLFSQPDPQQPQQQQQAPGSPATEPPLAHQEARRPPADQMPAQSSSSPSSQERNGASRQRQPADERPAAGASRSGSPGMSERGMYGWVASFECVLVLLFVTNSHAARCGHSKPHCMSVQQGTMQVRLPRSSLLQRPRAP